MRKTAIHADRYQYTAVFDPDGKGGYTVTVPALPGLVTEGDTFEDAKAMVEEAIVGTSNRAANTGRPFPWRTAPWWFPSP